MQFSNLRPFNFVWLNTSKTKFQIIEEQSYKAFEFYGLKKWKVKFDSAKRRAGCCDFVKETISFSKYFIEMNSLEEIESTIKHEIAHALAFKYFGAAKHCDKWKRIAIMIGDDGERYCGDNVIMPRGNVVLQCINCGNRIYYHKKIKTVRACVECCNKYNNGKYSDNFQFVMI